MSPKVCRPKRTTYEPSFKMKVIIEAEKIGNRKAAREFGVAESNIRLWRKHTTKCSCQQLKNKLAEERNGKDKSEVDNKIDLLATKGIQNCLLIKSDFSRNKTSKTNVMRSKTPKSKKQKNDEKEEMKKTKDGILLKTENKLTGTFNVNQKDTENNNDNGNSLEQMKVNVDLPDIEIFPNSNSYLETIETEEDPLNIELSVISGNKSDLNPRASKFKKVQSGDDKSDINLESSEVNAKVTDYKSIPTTTKKSKSIVKRKIKQSYSVPNKDECIENSDDVICLEDESKETGDNKKELNEINKSSDDSEDIIFLMSLFSAMKQLTNSQKTEFKTVVINAINKLSDPKPVSTITTTDQSKSAQTVIHTPTAPVSNIAFIPYHIPLSNVRLMNINQVIPVHQKTAVDRPKTNANNIVLQTNLAKTSGITMVSQDTINFTNFPSKSPTPTEVKNYVTPEKKQISKKRCRRKPSSKSRSLKTNEALPDGVVTKNIDEIPNVETEEMFEDNVYRENVIAFKPHSTLNLKINDYGNISFSSIQPANNKNTIKYLIEEPLQSEITFDEIKIEPVEELLLSDMKREPIN